jgi:predicted  nucleic acid-binding Zn-ribbon protein
MTTQEINELTDLIVKNIDTFSSTLKNYIDSKDNELNSSIQIKVDKVKEDILNQISINAEDLKALKDLLDSLDGNSDGEVNLQNALLKLLDRVDKLEEDNKTIKNDLTNMGNNITNISNNVKVNSDNLNAVFECMTNVKDVISLAESKFKIIGTATNSTSTNDTTSNEDNAL